MPDPTADPSAGPAPDPDRVADPVDLAAIGADLQWTDREAGRSTVERMPAGAGRLTALADWLGSVQGACPPRAPERVRLVQFGRSGAAAAAELAAEAGVGVRVLDELPQDPAAALGAGISVADREIDGGADLVIAACPGTGLAATVAISVLTDTEPVRALTRGAAATDPDAWMRRTAQVRDRRRAVAPLRERPGRLVAELGDPALAAATGYVLQAAVRRTPVLLDGTAAAAAALLAYQAQTRIVRWLAAAATSPDPAYGLAITTLGLRCLLELEWGGGDGTAALLALPLLRTAARLAADGPDGSDGPADAPAAHDRPEPGR
jgi:nicotinate-nucleotide--dimethylbenzimidazole phosphoribosyltransferase